jgi:hypothetical protein
MPTRLKINATAKLIGEWPLNGLSALRLMSVIEDAIAASQKQTSD